MKKNNLKILGYKYIKVFKNLLITYRDDYEGFKDISREDIIKYGKDCEADQQNDENEEFIFVKYKAISEVRKHQYKNRYNLIQEGLYIIERIDFSIKEMINNYEKCSEDIYRSYRKLLEFISQNYIEIQETFAKIIEEIMILSYKQILNHETYPIEIEDLIIDYLKAKELLEILNEENKLKYKMIQKNLTIIEKMNQFMKKTINYENKELNHLCEIYKELLNQIKENSKKVKRNLITIEKLKEDTIRTIEERRENIREIERESLMDKKKAKLNMND